MLRNPGGMIGLVILALAVTVALFGLAPRFASASWAVLVAFVALYLLGSLSGFPRWLRDLEPYSHIPHVGTGDFGPAALNLLGFLFFLTAASTFASAFGSDRRTTIGWLCGFYLVQLLMKLVARAVESFSWLQYGLSLIPI